ncbi:hypothetical protein [Paenibacillus daejeonensis]|uniref:hypothetical protein n=1 Tax=Paenibacillus daejeonensis TaxID=135193 RepID=UPI0003759DA2|nr:hypothetical protein [Paenibacillus daejeonensis]
MKKWLVCSIVLLVVIGSSVAVAAAQGKLFKGFPVVQVVWGGKTLEPKTDVPAIIMENRTMLPVYLFRQAGFHVDKKGDSVVIVDKRTPYLETIDKLQKFNFSTVEEIDAIQGEMVDLLKRMLAKDDQVPAAIEDLQNKLLDIKEQAYANGDFTSARTGMMDLPQDIYNTRDICEDWIQALDSLQIYLVTNQMNALDSFWDQHQLGNEKLKDLKWAYDRMFINAMVRAKMLIE